MASCNSLVSEEQLLCPICLKVFDQPVSTPCGHNFCMSCITTYWNETLLCQCPVCKDTFYVRPHLKVNTFISELTSQFLSLPQARSSGGPEWPGGGTVLCDVCADLQQEASRSCLNCLTSYCELHLEPHRRVSGLKNHTLVEPVVGLEDKVCRTHTRLNTRFCKKDTCLLCDVCAGAHNDHRVVSVPQAHKEMSVQLVKIWSRAQQLIQDWLQRLGVAREAAHGYTSEAEDGIRKNLQDLVILVLKIQSSILELTEELERRQKAADQEAPGLVGSMQAEIAALCGANEKLEQLQHTRDPFQFLKNFQSKSALPPANDATAIAFKRLVEAEHAWKSASKSVSLLRQVLHSTRTRLTLYSCYLPRATVAVAQPGAADPGRRGAPSSRAGGERVSV